MVEQSLFSLLNGLVGGRMYPLVAPDSPVAPFIVYQNINNSPEVCLDGNIPISNTRMQIDIYDKSYAGVKAIKAAMDAAMQGASLRNVPLNGNDFFEPSVKLYRVQQDYSIWY